MQVLRLTEYENMENSAQPGTSSGGKTETGAVKHNGLVGLFTDPFELSGQAAASGPAAKKAVDQSNMTPDAIIDQKVVELGTGHELDALLGKAFEDKSVWVGLWESIRDVFFPVKLPPLQLTSKPIPVPDRMAVKPNPWAIGISTTVNVAILCIILFFVGRKIVQTVMPNLIATDIDVGDYNAPKAANKAGGGGGGGDRSIIDANQGKLPKIEKDPITPPLQPVDHPLLPALPAIDVQKDIRLPDNPDMPMIGTKTSTNVTIASAGTGNGAGMGTGSGGGLGSGYGNGYGPGYGGNAGGGLYQIGGRISAPTVLHSVEAEFSDEARRAKYQGVCLISLIVDTQGNPQNIRIARALGMGLDEKAIEAIRQYKFRPAMKDGKTPVPVMITIEVDFRLY